MSTRVANCPSCGAVIEFQSAASLLVVCDTCQTASWRRDVDLELIGKVAELAPIESPLALRVRGRVEGRGFQIVGLVQLERERAQGGGAWNEWCALFDDGAHAWIAEAQGEYLVTRELTLDLAPLPMWTNALPELEVSLGELGTFVIVERATANVRTVRGELPEAIAPDSLRRYADLSGRDGGFATLDYGAGDACEAVYAGRRFSLAELALDTSGAEARAPRVARAAKIDCGKCGGSITLADPSGVERLGCPYCDALLDPSSQKARVVGIARTVRSTPKIPLGSRGTFGGALHEVIAYLVRSVTVEGERYPWDEYLLRGPDGSYRWLVCSRGHWSFVEPLNRAEVKTSARLASWKGASFRHFSGGTARVDLVLGEVYWPVEVGETVKVADYVAPPRMISVESSDGETTVSLGTYLEPREVQAAFKLPAAFPAPTGVGAQQPNPFPPLVKRLWAACGALTLLLLAMVCLFFALRRERQVWSTSWPISASASASATRSFASDEFELADLPTHLFVRAPGLPEGRITFDGALVESRTGVLHGFDLTAHSHSADDVLDTQGREEFVWPDLPAGRYRLRLELRDLSNEIGAERAVQFTIRQGGLAHPQWALLALLLLAAPPLLATLAIWVFENGRWQESDHA